MNRLIILLIFIIALQTLGCVSKENQPRDVVEAYFKCLAAKDSKCAIQYTSDEHFNKGKGTMTDFARSIDNMKESVDTLTFETKNVVSTESQAEVTGVQTVTYRDKSLNSGQVNVVVTLKRIDDSWKITAFRTDN